MPTWHPAALLRDETKKIDFIKDLQLVLEELKQEEVAQIQNIVARELNCKVENIHISTK